MRNSDRLKRTHLSTNGGIHRPYCEHSRGYTIVTIFLTPPTAGQEYVIRLTRVLQKSGPGARKSDYATRFPQISRPTYWGITYPTAASSDCWLTKFHRRQSSLLLLLVLSAAIASTSRSSSRPVVFICDECIELANDIILRMLHCGDGAHRQNNFPTRTISATSPLPVR